jgi:hypothetical protein
VAGQRPGNLTPAEGVAYDRAAALVSGGELPELAWRAAIAAFGPHGAAELSCLIGLRRNPPAGRERLHCSLPARARGNPADPKLSRFERSG